MADYKVCQRCKGRIDIEKEAFHHEPRKYWHKACWTEVMNEELLGIESQVVVKKERAIAVKKTDGSFDKIVEFATAELGMTKTMTEHRIKKLAQDGLDTKMLWSGLRYYYEELQNEPSPYKFWPAERYAATGSKHYDELEEILKFNEQQVKCTNQVKESASTTIRQSRWQPKIKEIELS